MQGNTIAAIATANGTGGVGIVRISGDMAWEISKRIFSTMPTESHKMVLGSVKREGVLIDEALCCFFKAPRSYTGEDVVELYCHGGMMICRMLLEAALEAGAVVAEAGEFTRRAFLNGKLDLAQAEAVGDMITATTEAAAITAASQLDGVLSSKISVIRNAALDISAHILATLDFPDEVDDLPREVMVKTVRDILNNIEILLATADDGRIIKDGVNAAITGAPNVGKSSLLNAIAGEDRAIVTSTAGTTRDVIETAVNIRGCRINLLDTAGIRDSVDEIEQMGVTRAKDAVAAADLIILVIDGSRKLTESDYETIDLSRGKNTICIVNKSDLTEVADIPEFEHVIRVSAKTGQGLERLFALVAKMYSRGGITSEPVITDERHRQSLVRAGGHIRNTISALESGAPPDISLGEIELCIAALGEISGLTVSDEIIDNIFSNFCVGK